MTSEQYELRIQDLLERNNELLERARAAEARAEGAKKEVLALQAQAKAREPYDKWVSAFERWAQRYLESLDTTWAGYTYYEAIKCEMLKRDVEVMRLSEEVEKFQKQLNDVAAAILDRKDDGFTYIANQLPGEVRALRAVIKQLGDMNLKLLEEKAALRGTTAPSDNENIATLINDLTVTCNIQMHFAVGLWSIWVFPVSDWKGKGVGFVSGSLIQALRGVREAASERGWNVGKGRAE